MVASRHILNQQKFGENPTGDLVAHIFPRSAPTHEFTLRYDWLISMPASVTLNFGLKAAVSWKLLQ